MVHAMRRGRYPTGCTRTAGRFVLLMLLCLLPLQLLAKSPQSQGFSRRMIDPADESLPAGGFAGEEEAPGFALPQVTPPVPGAELAGGIQVFVKAFRFDGNTIISDAELDRLAAPYRGRTLNTRELIAVRDLVTTAYITRGYISSGAVIPDQQVTDGVITIKVEEGLLGDVEIEDSGRLRDDFLVQRLEPAAPEALNINALQERLQLLQRKPQIDRINAALFPGKRRGESLLKLRVTEARPYYLSVKGNNYNAPSIGSEGVELDAGHYNLTGRGDVLGMEYTHTEGMDDFYAFYSLPLNARDTSLQLLYEKTDSEVVEEPFDILDIENDYEDIGLGISHPLFQQLNEHLILGMMLEYRTSETSLLGEDFSFSPGAEDGTSKVTVLRFSQEWLRRTPDRVFAVRSVFNQGLDLFDATTHSNAPDSRFFYWLGQFQWVQRLQGPVSQVQFRLDAQLSDDKLLPMEKFVVGGVETVRGYRENQLVRDNGVVASVEFRIPLLHGPDSNPTLQLAPFLDYGNAWEKGGSTPSPRSISAAGIGLLWNPHKQLYCELYAAKAFRNIDQGDTEHNLQDDSIYLGIEYKVF